MSLHCCLLLTPAVIYWTTVAKCLGIPCIIVSLHENIIKSNVNMQYTRTAYIYIFI